MNKLFRQGAVWGAAVIIASQVFFVSGAVSVLAVDPVPVLTTDKADYRPGETVTIFGSLFHAFENVLVTVFGGSESDGSYMESSQGVTADANGSFTATTDLDFVFRSFYTVTATSGSTELARTTFTDASGASVDEYSQCANDDGDGYTGADVGCHWTNGNLQASNSTYHEDDATVQRLAIDDLTIGNHTVIIKYSTTKGGKHSYDFLTDDNFSELAPNTLTSADLCDPSLTNLPGCSGLAVVSSGLIPADPNAAGHDVARAARHFKIRNGTWVGSGISSGPTLVSGTYAGDSDTAITLQFNVPSTCAGKHSNKCEVLITWGAHVSTQADWGAGSSAVSISGSPYHVQIADIDGTSLTGGGRDNQMAATAIIVQPTLKLVKTVVGGTAVVNDFQGKIDGANITWGVAQTVTIGSHTASEVTLPNYTPGVWGGDCAANGSVTLAAGQNKTCTITNTYVPPAAKLTVTKVVINDDGGTKVVADFPLFVGATGVTSGVQNSFNPGTYTVSETGDPAYAATISGDCAPNGSITLANGDVKSCTITNDDIDPVVHVIKHVINDNGGTAVAGDFTITVTNHNPVPSSFFGSETGTDVTLGAGTYNVTEGSAPGYTVSYSEGCSGTLAPGAEAICTITNDDQQAYITVVKAVTNDNGGSAAPDDFALTLEGNTVLSGVAVPVNPGTYTAGETNLPGYTFNGFSGDCDQNGDVTVALGQSKTCTLTNDDQQAYIIVDKTVVNDNGGSAAPDDFSLTVDGHAVLDEVAVPVNPGAHVAGETNLPGYTAGTWSGDCDANGNVTVALGQTKTCTITNDDQPGTLHIVKVVDNGTTGATAGPEAFSFQVNGDLAVSFESDGQNDMTVDAGTYSVTEPATDGYTTTYDHCDNLAIPNGGEATCTVTNTAIAPQLTVIKVVDNGNTGATYGPSDFQMLVDAGNFPQNSAQSVTIGAHAVGESGPSGYTAVFSGDCNAQGEVSLTLGESKTCTITNTAIAPKLTLVKTVVNNNGGTKVVADFPLFVDGNGVTSGVATDATIGGHVATETGDSGYAASVWGGDCDSNGNVTVALGQTKTCTITNDDIAPRLTVIKHVINDDGDQAQASDFTMVVTGTTVSTPSFAGNESGVTVTLNAGAYSVDEATSAGYVKTLGADCSGTIAVGQSKTCTITNNDKPHATRTQGFWQTHTVYTTSVFGANSWTIGTHQINNTSRLFAGFYASISKKTNGTKRAALDQARMQLLQQWLATQLNCQAFGCTLSTQTLLANAATVWNGTNAALINSFASQLDAYNNSNDALPISGQGRATPAASQASAAPNLVFWDVLP